MNHLLQGRAADIRNVAQLPPLHRPDGNCHSPQNSPNKKTKTVDRFMVLFV